MVVYHPYPRSGNYTYPSRSHTEVPGVPTPPGLPPSDIHNSIHLWFKRLVGFHNYSDYIQVIGLHLGKQK